MGDKLFSTLLMIVSVSVLAGLNLLTMPPGKPNGLQAKEEREFLIHYYLMFKQTPNIPFSKWEPGLRDHWEQSSKNPAIGEAIAFFYGLEGDKKKAETLLADMKDYDSDTLRYALEYGDTLPEEWESKLAQDWVGAKMAVLIYKRNKQYRRNAEALINLRHFETRAAQFRTVYGAMDVLQFVGMVLLVSMWFSQRHFQAKGQSFFQLRPLGFNMDALFQFCGFFLLGFVLLSVAVGLAIPSDVGWVGIVTAYLLQIAWGIYLVKWNLFRGLPHPILETLGFRDLKMRWVYLFQIFGGLAVLVACYRVAGILMSLVSWPFDSNELMEQYKKIMEDPLNGGILFMTVCVVAPIFEELLFRGIIFRVLLAHLKPWLALVGSALLFALMHPPSSWPVIFAIGLGLGLVYYRSGNLLINIWAHALWNVLALFVAQMDLTV